MTKLILWGDLIKIAREDIAKNGEIKSGKLRGPGASLSIVLFADKFNKTYKTTDDTIFQFTQEHQIKYDTRPIDIGLLFKNYHKLLEHSKKPEHKDPNHKVNDKDYQIWWIARNSDLQSWIYIYVIHLLYEMEYETHRKASLESAKIKNKAKDIAKEILKSIGKTRCDYDDAVYLQKELLEKHGIKRGIKTIYEWF